jgi:hypothetical protein
MKRIAVEVTIKQTILLREDTWRESFGSQLPVDSEDVDMLKNESLSVTEDLVDSKVSSMEM